MRERRNDLEIRNEIPQIALQIPNSDRSPLYDVRYHARRRPSGLRMRIDFSRTMMKGVLLAGYLSIFNSIWWSQTGSNRRPHACKARALPTELLPQGGEKLGWEGGAAHDWWAWEDSNFRPHAYQARALTN